MISKKEHFLDEIKLIQSELSVIIDNAKKSPVTSIATARRVTEKICQSIYYHEIEAADKTGFEAFISELSKSKHLSKKNVLPFRTLQQYGNHASHPPSDNQVLDSYSLATCLSSLIEVLNWFFLEYLNSDMPEDVANFIDHNGVGVFESSQENKNYTEINNQLECILSELINFLDTQKNNHQIEIIKIIINSQFKQLLNDKEWQKVEGLLVELRSKGNKLLSNELFLNKIGIMESILKINKLV